MTTDTLYEQDFVAWTERQASALRDAAGQRSNLPLDWENLAEEIESVGRSERFEVRSLMAQIVSHLLKLKLSPAPGPRDGWESEVSHFRLLIATRLEGSPSLRARIPDLLPDVLQLGRREASKSLLKYGEREAADLAMNVDLSITVDDILDGDFFLPGTTFRREPG